MTDMPQQAAAAARPAGDPVAVVDPPRATLDPALTQQPATLVRVDPVAQQQQREQQREPHEQTRGTIIVFDSERHKILTDTIMPTATPAEVEFFKLVCIRTGLDPFARQIHAVKRSQKVKNNWVDKWSFQVAIDGFRLIAERTGKYRGQELPLFCGDDALWREVWLAREYPRASKVGVLRVDFDATLYGLALWDEYVQTKDDYVEDETGQSRKAGTKSPAAMWAKMPSVMLAKVAEAIALRKAFPQELGGLYTDDEMSQADSDRERTDDERQHDQAAATRRASRRTQSGETARGGSNAAARAAAPAPNWTNGSAVVFPYGGFRERGISLDAVYNVGATRTKKGKKGAPDETIACGNEYVISDKRLLEAIDWLAGKFAKHDELESHGATGGEGWLDDADRDRLNEWADAMRAEIKRRNGGEWPKPDAQTTQQSSAEVEQRPDPTSTSASDASASSSGAGATAVDKTATTATNPTAGTPDTRATTATTDSAPAQRTSMDPQQAASAGSAGSAGSAKKRAKGESSDRLL